MTFASELLDDLDDIRSIPDELGLCPFDVIVRIVTWSGETVGEGTPTIVDTPFVVAGGRRPRVRQMTMKDIVASGGIYHDQDMKVGPLTPSYSGGGVAYSTIDPSAVGGNVEVYYRVSGGSMPSGGAWFDKFREMTDHAMSSYLVLRRVAVQNPGGAP